MLQRTLKWKLVKVLLKHLHIWNLSLLNYFLAQSICSGFSAQYYPLSLRKLAMQYFWWGERSILLLSRVLFHVADNHSASFDAGTFSILPEGVRQWQLHHNCCLANSNRDIPLIINCMPISEMLKTWRNVHFWINEMLLDIITVPFLNSAFLFSSIYFSLFLHSSAFKKSSLYLLSSFPPLSFTL